MLYVEIPEGKISDSLLDDLAGALNTDTVRVRTSPSAVHVVGDLVRTTIVVTGVYVLLRGLLRAVLR